MLSNEINKRSKELVKELSNLVVSIVDSRISRLSDKIEALKQDFEKLSYSSTSDFSIHPKCEPCDYFDKDGVCINKHNNFANKKPKDYCNLHSNFETK